MIGKDLEGSYHGLIEILPGICLEELKKNMRNLRISSVLARIQTDHLLNERVYH
jgi:hypothetical protein